jgi:hypothetical protein
VREIFDLGEHHGTRAGTRSDLPFWSHNPSLNPQKWDLVQFGPPLRSSRPWQIPINLTKWGSSAVTRHGEAIITEILSQFYLHCSRDFPSCSTPGSSVYHLSSFIHHVGRACSPSREDKVE